MVKPKPQHEVIRVTTRREIERLPAGAVYRPDDNSDIYETNLSPEGGEVLGNRRWHALRGYDDWESDRELPIPGYAWVTDPTPTYF